MLGQQLHSPIAGNARPSPVRRGMSAAFGAVRVEARRGAEIPDDVREAAQERRARRLALVLMTASAALTSFALYEVWVLLCGAVSGAG